MKKNYNAVEYKMPKKEFDMICKTRNKEEQRKNPHTYVMEYLNKTAGIKGEITHLIIY
jgi:hypothetical protein